MIIYRPLSDLLRGRTPREKLQQGWSPQCERHPANVEGWGVLKTTAIQEGMFLDYENKQLPAELPPRPGLEVRAGDLLITCAGPRSRCGVATLIRSTRSKLMLSGKMYRFRANEDLVDSRFLELFLMSPDAQTQIETMKTGISDSGLNLTKARFLSLRVPFVPLLQQRQLVDVIEEQLPRLDAGARGLESAMRHRDLLLGSLIKASQSERDPLRSLGELSVLAGYGTSTKCATDGAGVPVVRIPNLIDGQIDLTDEKRAMDTSVDLSKLMLEPDDLLIVRTNGSMNLIGRASVVQEGITASFASYLIRFRIDPAQARAPWIRCMLEAPAQRKQLEKDAASSAGQFNLSLKKLNDIYLPVPELVAQDRLLARFDEIHDATRALSNGLARARRRRRALRKSLFAAAFSGQLAIPRNVQQTEEFTLV